MTLAQRVLVHVVMLLLVLISTAGSNSANLLIPDGVGTGDAKIEDRGTRAASAFFVGAARTYDMLSGVEVKNIDAASTALVQASRNFGSASSECKSLKGLVSQNAKAKSSIVSRQPALKDFKNKYAAVGAIPTEESKKWNDVLKLAADGKLEDLVALCETAGQKMVGLLKDFDSALRRRGGPTQVESWKLMTALEEEMLTLRYGAILVEGPTDPK